ncbi:hypothetical protein HYQ46_000260 [Verticillium longisporum]|nr:hypothetical protein HYQ46_000260 [Verticillium longisporum]
MEAWSSGVKPFTGFRYARKAREPRLLTANSFCRCHGVEFAGARVDALNTEVIAALAQLPSLLFSSLSLRHGRWGRWDCRQFLRGVPARQLV